MKFQFQFPFWFWFFLFNYHSMNYPFWFWFFDFPLLLSFQLKASKWLIHFDYSFVLRLITIIATSFSFGHTPNLRHTPPPRPSPFEFFPPDNVHWGCDWVLWAQNSSSPCRLLHRWVGHEKIWYGLFYIVGPFINR